MQLRNIINWESSNLPRNKIQHQIDNEGCKCNLCQKIVINEMKVIKTYTINDNQSELTKGKRQQFFSNFILEFNFIDKMSRKVKVIFPEICVFEKGMPICLASKKRETLPIKMIKNKEKLNGFEINNFFIDGFTFHNNFKETQKRVKTKVAKENQKNAYTKFRKQHYHYDEALKNECITIAKFINGTCQMMTPMQLTNLFKSKQRLVRNDLLYLTTLVCSSNYEEIRINIDLQKYEGSKLFERAKNQVKMINEDIKPKDFLFIPERQERKYEDILKDQEPEKYLQYLSIKLLLLYSLRTDILFKDCIFKFVKDQIDTYYLIDLQVYHKTTATKVWGNFQNNKAFIQSPQKQKKIRPTSSPERLQRNRRTRKTYEDNGELIIPEETIFESKKLPKSVNGRMRTIGSIKLQPIYRPLFNRYEH